MATIAERNERMTRILADLKSVVMWVQGETNKTPSLHDTEGDCLVVLPEYLIPVLDRVADDEAGAILEAISDCASYVSREGFQHGVIRGRENAIGQFHEFLGIDRICAALTERNS